MGDDHDAEDCFKVGVYEEIHWLEQSVVCSFAELADPDQGHQSLV